MDRVYLDPAATTPLDPRVLEAMMPYLTTYWGNPSSLYAEAQEARKGLEGARRTIGGILGCRPQDGVAARLRRAAPRRLACRPPAACS